MFLFIEKVFAKWLEVYTVPKLTAAETTLIGCLAIPETSVIDNGSQFVSNSFNPFRSMSLITRVRLSPHHPQMNGQVDLIVEVFTNTELVCYP